MDLQEEGDGVSRFDSLRCDQSLLPPASHGAKMVLARYSDAPLP